MKTMKMILAGVLLMLPLLCQAQKNLFNKYGDMKGVSSVYISKAMIETNPNLFTKDVYIGKVSGQLNSVQVLSTMDNNVKKEMRKDLRSLVQSSRYELLMKQKGTVSSSEFYMSRKGEKVKELIMIVDGAATLKFVYLEGDMTLNGYTEYHDVSEYQLEWEQCEYTASGYKLGGDREVEEPRLAWRIEAFARTGIERAGKCSQAERQQVSERTNGYRYMETF